MSSTPTPGPPAISNFSSTGKTPYAPRKPSTSAIPTLPSGWPQQPPATSAAAHPSHNAPHKEPPMASCRTRPNILCESISVDADTMARQRAKTRPPRPGFHTICVSHLDPRFWRWRRIDATQPYNRENTCTRSNHACSGYYYWWIQLVRVRG